MFDLRLIRAELLKLRRRRGMLAICAGLTLGVVVIYYGVLAILHLTDPSGRGPAGGLENFESAMGVLAMAGGVVGVIVGATAGGADIEAGVFRDLAATGRDRTALFLARLPGAWAVVLPLLAVSVALPALLATLLSGPQEMTVHAAYEGGVQVLSIGALTAAVSVGLAALFGARGMVMGVVLAFYLGIAPLLAQVEALGDARQAIPQMATSRLGGADVEGMALGTAVAVVLTWMIVSMAAGAWRTRTQEI